ncbi:MAG: hypothetical protein ABIQ30_17965 [Devosia sp.]
MSHPIHADPIFDGAADPTLIHRRGTNEWWMFYTVRRAAHEGPGVQWVHGSPIGVAVSSDDGASWDYQGTVSGLDDPADPGLNTHWAPEVIWGRGEYHMYLSYIAGTPDQWQGYPRHIVHFTSPDLVAWTRRSVLPLASDFVIDAAVALCPDGLYRLWYKDEAHGACTGVATSSDLYAWTTEGIAISGSPDGNMHEGPNVFDLDGHWWMIVDEWRGQAVFRSSDAISWTRQGIILAEPGTDPMDIQIARHADVVTQDGWAAIIYFTHPNTAADHTDQMHDAFYRRSVVHWAKLTVRGGQLIGDRNVSELRLSYPH